MKLGDIPLENGQKPSLGNSAPIAVSISLKSILTPGIKTCVLLRKSKKKILFLF